MKYCPYCGAELPDGGVYFCGECGRPLPQAENREPKTVKAEQLERQPKTVKGEQLERQPKTNTTAETDEGYDGYYDDVLPDDDAATGRWIRTLLKIDFMDSFSSAITIRCLILNSELQGFIREAT